MKTAVVYKSSCQENNLRLDPSFHLSEGVSAKRAILNGPYGTIPCGKAAMRIFNGGRYKRIYVTNPQCGIPLISSSGILKADLSDAKLVSKKFSPEIEDRLVQKGWILISRSGTIGNTAFTNSGHAQKLASEHVIRLVPNDILRAGYLYAFLSSKFGYALLTQGTFGAVIQHIECPHVANIPVPVFPDEMQKEIDTLIREAASLRDKAAELFEESVDYFNKLLPSERETTKIFKKSIKALNFSWAAYNNNIECDDIYSLMSDGIQLSKLTETVFAPPLFKHIYLSNDNGYPFMTGAELSQQCLPPYRWLSPKGVKEIHDYVVEEGTLLLYKSGNIEGGILGNVFIVDKWLNGFCLSDHVIRIKMKDKRMAYWTYAFLKSRAGKKLLLQLATGAVIPFITPDRLNNLIKIPAPTAEFDTICEKIDRYLTYRSESNFLELKAISMVEAEIESWDKNEGNK